MNVYHALARIAGAMRLGRCAPAVEPEQASIRLIIEGVEVFAAEAVPIGSVKFCAPGHPWNPTEANILVCNLETYVSLAASADSQRLVAFMVVEALRALRVKERAELRQQRRKARRATSTA